MSKPRARFATALPMSPPPPMSPTVWPCTKDPTRWRDWAPGNFPARTMRSPSPIRRATASISPNVKSAVASVVTWTIWLAKTLEIVVAKRRTRTALRRLAAVASLADVGVVPSPGAELVAAARAEIRVSADAFDKDGLKERIASRLERIEAAFARRISRATGVLATIGATAPFVGLFGTVWGIMNSFIGISKAHTTNLAVVAPGIAEALLATAFGLAAAIPAVVIYNMFARSISGYRALLGDASAEVLRLVSRDLDRQADGSASPLHRPAAISAAE